MAYTPRLDILRQLREARGLNQAEMARLCGLQGKQSQQTVGAWERGEMKPGNARRGGMMRYLWDGLLLRDDPAKFEEVWEILVEVWLWEPISDREWRDFTHQARLQPPNRFAEQLARLEAALEQAQNPPVKSGGEASNSSAELLALDTNVLPSPAPLPRGSVMPLSRNPFFVGRDRDLLALAGVLRERQTAAISPVEMAAATGLGGIGKTQLASEFVHRYGQFFPGGVFWLSFENASAVPTEIAACGGAGALELRPDFATRSLEEQVRLVQAAWQESTPRLLVFDNCEEPELVARWRPTSGGCRILITSRRGEWDPLLNVQQLALAVFVRSESIALLHRHCPHAEEKVLDAIAAELGDLPLALHLAGSYLYRYRRAITPEQYLANLRDPKLLSHPSFAGGGISPTDHVQHVGRTFALSYERLRPADERDALALRLLTHMAFFAPGEPAWYDTLVRTLDLDPNVEADALRAEDAFARLIELGLIQVEDEKGMRIHRLVAAFVQESPPEVAISGQRKIEEIIYESLRLANQNVTPLMLLPGNVHIRHVVDAAFVHEPLWGATLAMELGRYLWHAGDFSGAHSYFLKALNVRQSELGKNDVTTAQSYIELGYTLRDMEQFESGRIYLEQGVEILEELLGAEHVNVAEALNELSYVYAFESKFDLELVALRRAYAICERVLGNEHTLTADVATNLGIALLDDFLLPLEAQPYIELALQIRRRLLGAQHPNTAHSYHNLGYLLDKLGDSEAAKVAYEQALTIRRAVFTDDHPATILTLCMFGSLLTRMGQVALARDYLDQAAAAALRTLGEANLLTAVSSIQLGLNLQASGDYDKARWHLLRALKIRTKSYGEENLRVAEILELLGRLCYEQGKKEEAQDYLRQASAIAQHLFGEDHVLVKRVRPLLASF